MAVPVVATQLAVDSNATGPADFKALLTCTIDFLWGCEIK
jgi:hypothetical protein